MKKLLLHEDMFFDIPNVDYKLDTELELKGPEPGEDVGVSGLLLDLIGDVAKNINDYNQLQANLENYPEVAEMIKDFADEENMKLGKIQSALKTISPNAEYIMNGAVEAEQEMDPGSPIDESLKESNDSWEEYYDSDLQRRFYFIDAPGGKGEITYQDNDGNGYYRCSVWLNRRTHKYRTFNVTTSLKDAKEKVETLIDKYSDSKQESFDNEYWDSSRALDLATYCWDKGYDEDKAYQVTVAQLKKEGSTLPKDLDRVKTVIYDYYDEQSDGEDDFLDESYGLYEMARVKRPNPENMKMLDSGYCNAYEWKAEKQKQISKYKKQYPGVKCELVKTDTPGLRMWMTYIEKE